MRIFIDSADVAELRALAGTGLVDGVTTNPSLMAKESGDPRAILKQICRIVQGPVSAEVVATDAAAMIREGRELAAGEEVENLVLEFRPRPTQDMLIACLWSKWTGTGEADLLSFAAITDEPPDEVAAAGHDRCIVPIRPGYIDEWLNPLGRHAQELLDILEDRERPYYEHRLAA